MRARNIKPGFFDNEDVGELSMTARLLFIGLWCMADRDGILEYRPKKIKARIFPYDSLNLIKFLEEISETGLITIWVDEKKVGHFIEIPNFLKHQRPHPKEKQSNLRHILDESFNLIKLHEIKCNSRLMLGCSDIRNPDIRKQNTCGVFENVFLSDEQLTKLQDRFGADTDNRINALSEYMQSKGKRYKDHYATILSWARRDEKNGKHVNKREEHDETRSRWAKELLDAEHGRGGDEAMVNQIQGPEA